MYSSDHPPTTNRSSSNAHKKDRHFWRRRKKIKQRLIREQKHRCCYCKNEVVLLRLRPGETQPTNLATLEHKVPQSQGGDDSPDNLAIACRQCNRVRGDRYTFADFKVRVDTIFVKIPGTCACWYVLTHEMALSLIDLADMTNL